MVIFRAYDIRGIYGKHIDFEVMKDIGRAFGSFVEFDKIVLGRDARITSPEMSKAFTEGVISTGKNIIDIGLVPLGAGMFYAWQKKLPYAYITASHLPKEYTGLKMFHPSGLGFLEDEIKEIEKIYSEKKFQKGSGTTKKEDSQKVLNLYKDFLSSKIKAKRPLKVVLDCGNGAAGVIAKKIFEESGFDTKAIFEEPDGDFPNRSPDNKEDPLTELRNLSKEADLGISFDGDGDRVFLIDEQGRKVAPEHMAYIVLSELLKTEKGPIVANVECTRAIDDIAKKYSRDVIRIRVGHTFLMMETTKNNAVLGLETSGHFIMPSLLPMDDSLAISLYAAVVLSKHDKKLSDIVSEIPFYPFQRFNLECDDEKKTYVIDQLKKKLSEEFPRTNTLDGVRVDLSEGWVLVRQSNTEPIIRVSIEAEDEQAFENMRNHFIDLVKEEIKKA